MSKSEPILKIEPENELRFRGPFKEATSAHMKLTNTTERDVCFKVKTTAPKRYCVKPTTGVLKALADINILVSLQPFDPNDPNEKGKHKFQVLSMYAPEGEYNIDTLWKEASPDQIHDWKLKCVLEMPEDGTTGSTPSAATQPASLEATTAPVTGSAPSKPSEEKTSKDGAAVQKVSKLESELQKASDEIRNLREELSRAVKENIELKEEGLRLRRVAAAASTSGDSGSAMKMAPPPLHPSHAAEQVALNQTQMIMLLVAVILGVILGKILF